MGRYIFNQNLAKMATHFGMPNPVGEEPITLDFPIDALRKSIPEFPQDGKLQITFVRSIVKSVTFRPDFSAKKLFQFLFGYQAPTQIIVGASQITGGYNDICCLGDGVGADTQMTGSGDNSIRFYYNGDFIAPYDLLEAQKFKLDPQGIDRTTETQNHEYPWLSERQISETDIQGMNTTLLYVMHHSIYARKGLIFYNGFLKRVFEKQAWYRPLYPIHRFKKEVIPKLSTIEQANLKFLRDRFWDKL
ncbi:MAG: YARHG domain-containing protein [Oscillatoriales cyanobacterium C42_A2020_001]|nr:YARHG domain-containing protein [Leptolyngbyaceae cyanobacterium C42_A2020_001]